MSLKVVHVVFVTALSLLCFGTAAVLLARGSAESGGGDWAWGVASAVAGVAVVAYGWYLLRKLRSRFYP